MKTYKFYAECTIQAQDIEEAREIFYNESNSFVSGAELVEVEDDDTDIIPLSEKEDLDRWLQYL
jgi:hypothetical protein